MFNKTVISCNSYITEWLVVFEQIIQCYIVLDRHESVITVIGVNEFQCSPLYPIIYVGNYSTS